MQEAAELINATAALLWVALAFAALFMLRNIISASGGALTKLGLGPTGVSMEFAEAKLDEVISATDEQTRRAVGSAARRSALDRLQRHADVLARSNVLWVDDHPENNAPIVELLRRFGATVETPLSNADAFDLLGAAHYDVIISDVARDHEGPNTELKGVEFADAVHERWGQPTILFTARFDPTTLPRATDEERIALVSRLQRSVFARTNRMDELLHYLVDVLER